MEKQNLNENSIFYTAVNDEYNLIPAYPEPRSTKIWTNTAYLDIDLLCLFLGRYLWDQA